LTVTPQEMVLLKRECLTRHQRMRLGELTRALRNRDDLLRKLAQWEAEIELCYRTLKGSYDE
jgi:hypothetical protein